MVEHKVIAINYGVNIRIDGDPCWNRYTTVDNLTEATVIYDVLCKDNEPRFWTDVEIEQINTLDNGDFDYKVIKRKSNRTYDLKTPFKEFCEKVAQKYSVIRDITDEEEYDDDEGNHYHRYICWLKFPYYSLDSKGGFFSFHTEEEFEGWLDYVCRYTVGDLINGIEYENYQEFVDICTNKGVILSDLTREELLKESLKIYFKDQIKLMNNKRIWVNPENAKEEIKGEI